MAKCVLGGQPASTRAGPEFAPANGAGSRPRSLSAGHCHIALGTTIKLSRHISLRVPQPGKTATSSWDVS
jgi:hypothetical protein